MYHYWNMMDPVVGGLSIEKIALRRAMAMAYDVNEEIRIVRNGQAVEALYPIPPGVVGHDANYRGIIKYDPDEANALLDKFGYKKAKDGWRTLPDGKPLIIRYASRPDSLGRQQDEMWKKAFDSISIRMEIQKDKFPELLKLEKQCKLQMRTASWIADYPDADNFMQLLYGKNIYQSNNACAVIPEFDRLYEQSVAHAGRSGARQALSEDDARSWRSTRRGGWTSAAIATCWCSRACWATRNTRCCTPSGSTSISTQRSRAGSIRRIPRDAAASGPRGGRENPCTHTSSGACGR